MLDLDPTLIESHPNYESLLQYGSLLSDNLSGLLLY
jgi:hypothetical protein